MTIPSVLRCPTPSVPNVLITFPAPHVLLVTLNRPAQLNAIPSSQHAPLAALWDWYDGEPHLRCAILTGTGRAFCAGADLREWDELNSGSSSQPHHGEEEPKEREEKGKGDEEEKEEREEREKRVTITPAGFGGLSNRRRGKKPILAAVNGLCLGGGMEMLINCDVVLSTRSARFGLPEVTRGVVALAGALPRLVGAVGRQRAGEMALLGRIYGAEEMYRWGVVNFLVDDGDGKDVVKEAVKVAQEIAGNSPDAVIVSREGVRLGEDGLGMEKATEVLLQGLFKKMDGGENMREGVRSFVEKRKPVWTDSKL